MSEPLPVPRPRLYLDTSAYLCVLLAEDGAERIGRETEGAELLSSVLLLLEARRTIVRMTRAGILTEAQYQLCLNRIEQDAGAFILRDLTLDLCQSSPLPAIAVPRSLDLAHLRTALWFHGDAAIDRFVTLDLPQRQAAQELGLPV